MVDEITQQGLLPGVKDPNLWMVKCKIGEEKATAIALMRKFIAYQFTDEPLQIKSVVSFIRGSLLLLTYLLMHVYGSEKVQSFQSFVCYRLLVKIYDVFY